MWFGSNGLIDQPSSIVQSFTKRASTDMTKYPSLLENYKVLKPTKTPESDWQKYIVNTAYKVDNIDIHTVVIEGTSACLSNCIDSINPLLLINHYATQSKNFFLQVKSPRGDVNNWVAVGTKNEHWFSVSDINEISDMRLADQNKKYGIAMDGNAKCDMSEYAKAAAITGASKATTATTSTATATATETAIKPTTTSDSTTTTTAATAPATPATALAGPTTVVSVPEAVIASVATRDPTKSPVAVPASKKEATEDAPPPPSSKSGAAKDSETIPNVADIAAPPIGKTIPEKSSDEVYVVHYDRR